MRSILIATTNEAKYEQIKRIFENYGITNICSLRNVMPIDEPEEDGSTCQANAFIKAEYYAERFPQYCVLADDSGIFIEEFGGAPGVYSARWGGAHNTQNIRQKLESSFREKGIERSNAFFECAMVFKDLAKDITITTTCTLKGIIKLFSYGTQRNGCAYDSYFIPTEAGYEYDTLAMIKDEGDIDEIDRITHRGKAANSIASAIVSEYYLK